MSTSKENTLAEYSRTLSDIRKGLDDRSNFDDYRNGMRVSILYMKHGYLGCDDKITFGFFDPGRIGTQAYGIHDDFWKYLPAVSSREILFVCSSESCSFNKLKTEVRIMKQIGKSWEDQVKHVALRINSKTAAHDSREHHFEGLVSVFHVRKGCCRHVSLMFKWACDTLGFKCCLLRGDVTGMEHGAHAWNVVVSPSGEVYVIDVLNAPLNLYTQRDILRGVDKIHVSARAGLKFVKNFKRIGGGVGHSVVRPQ